MKNSNIITVASNEIYKNNKYKEMKNNMKLTIRMDLDNIAFRDIEDESKVDYNAISDAIDRVSFKISKGIIESAILDINGNIVGQYTIEE